MKASGWTEYIFSIFAQTILANVTFRISCNWSEKFRVFGCIRKNANYLNINIIRKLIETGNSVWRVILPLDKADGGILFSYQNLSPFLRIWNCCPSRQPKVGPTTAPDNGRSANPPINKSMSSTCCKCTTVNLLIFTGFS